MKRLVAARAGAEVAGIAGWQLKDRC